MTSRSRNGFSLLEVLVAMTASAFVLVGVVGVMRAQQQTYMDGQRVREAQGSARNTLLYVEQRLATAGYGLSPSLAFDLDRYAGPCPDAFTDGCSRDAIATTDELVFFSRDLAYWVPTDPSQEPRGHAWRVLSLPSATTVRLSGRVGDSFRKGQIVQLVCHGAAFYAYGTVDESVAPLAAAGAFNVTLLAAEAGNPFRAQDLANDACFSSGTARAFLVNRYRFHVRPVAVTGEAWTYDPYLVLDTGVDANGDDTIDEADEVVVGAFIDDFQVAYQLANGATVGATPGTGTTFEQGYPGTADATDHVTTLEFPGPDPATGESPYTPTSWYRFTLGPPAAAERGTDHQANIRAVRVALTARSPRPDPQLQAHRIPRSLNADDVPSWADPTGTGADGFQRVTFETTVHLPNMTIQGMTYF
jgi:type IV pilus assembly protein PilW